MAHTKAQGSSRNGRESNAQRLGIKLFGGHVAKPGSIIVRQRGSRWKAGANVMMGSDDTLFSTVLGTVLFGTRRRVSVIPATQEA